ncbi:MAG: polysaccharide pyruvyl transferase family protein [Clostridium sp.]|nr:polysaccharide pyruvyl transferase family protein [Clostridium sp.]
MYSNAYTAKKTVVYGVKLFFAAEHHRKNVEKGMAMIGILTFYWADDYGALLQSYALKTYLNKYQKTILIPYFPEPLRSRYKLMRDNWIYRFWCRGYHIKRQIKALKQFCDKFATKYKMNCFRKKYLIKSRKMLNSSRDIYEFGRKAKIDIYVVGSDQVWNPEITDGFQEGYFCTFRPWSGEEKRYIAYAASLGSECLPDRYRDSLSKLLANFNLISLRERQAVPYIRQMYDKPLTVALDPVFLLEKEEWEALATKQKRRKEKYIVVYYAEYNTAMAEYLKCLEKKSSLSVLLLTSNNADKNIARWTPKSKYIVGCSPLEFLNLFYYAEYVVTNSFHGTAMSIMFQKQFAVFSHGPKGARILNLLDLCRLKNRLGNIDGKTVEIDEPINWEQVGEFLRKERECSQAFIKKEILYP